MYPYVDQLLGYRASDPVQKLRGLLLEVKVDVCAHVREMLARRGRGEDYVEISLTSPLPVQPGAQRFGRLPLLGHDAFVLLPEWKALAPE
jgi:hypothetical protein